MIFSSCYSDRHSWLIPKNAQEINDSSQINSNWDVYLSSYLSKEKNKSFSSKTIKYPLTNSETKAYYQDLYQCQNEVNLEAHDPKYELGPMELLRNLCVQFVLKLCNAVIDSIPAKSEYLVTIFPN